MRHAVGTSVKGLVMLASICQSTVLHTFRLWSSAWEAMYLPTGSHVRPLTSPVWPRKHVTISVEKKRKKLPIWLTCFLSTEQYSNHQRGGPRAKFGPRNRPNPACHQLLTWKFPCVPDDDSVVDAAGGEPHVMRRPSHVHHI